MGEKIAISNLFISSNKSHTPWTHSFNN